MVERLFCSSIDSIYLTPVVLRGAIIAIIFFDQPCDSDRLLCVQGSGLRGLGFKPRRIHTSIRVLRHWMSLRSPTKRIQTSSVWEVLWFMAYIGIYGELYRYVYLLA